MSLINNLLILLKCFFAYITKINWLNKENMMN